MAKFKEYLVRGVYAVLFVLVFLVMSVLLGGFVTEGEEFDEMCMARCTKDGYDADTCRTEVCIH